MNTDPEVNSVQFYERGTQPLKEAQTDKDYFSAHKRDAEGIPNFIFYSTGYLDGGKNIVLTDSGFRHASFPPIALYKQSTIKEIIMRSAPITLPSPSIKSDTFSMQDDMVVEIKETIDVMRYVTVNMTTHNMKHFCQEAYTRLNLDEKTQKTQPLTWINVSLLTVTNDKEKQERQFDETMLAADRIRSEKGVHPITFTLGVNWAATGTFPTYPSKQRFENERAYFQMQLGFLERLEKINAKIKEDKDPCAKPINALIEKLLTLKELAVVFKQEIDDDIAKTAEIYNNAFLDYQTKPNDVTLLVLYKAEATLQKTKQNFYTKANDYFTQQTAAFASIATELEPLLKEIDSKQTITTAASALTEGRNSLNFAIQDFIEIQKLLTHDQWQTKANNFKLQTHLLDLANNQSKLDSFYQTNTQTASSFNCKSNNDRSGTEAAHLDQLRAKRQTTTGIDPFKQYATNACCLSQPYDTDGGGGKFGAHFYDSGHPYKEYATMQEMTSSLASHKFLSKALKTGVPTKMKLTSSLSVTIDLVKYMYKKNLQNAIDEIKEPTHKTLFQIDTKFFYAMIESKLLALSESTFQADYFMVDMLIDFRNLIESKKDIPEDHKKIIEAALKKYFTKLKVLPEFSSIAIKPIAEEKAPKEKEIETDKKVEVDEMDEMVENLDDFLVDSSPDKSMHTKTDESKKEPSDEEKAIENCKDKVKNYQSFRQALDTRAFTKYSEKTKKVDKAYQTYFLGKDKSNDLEKMQHLFQLREALNEWIQSKHLTQYAVQQTRTETFKYYFGWGKSSGPATLRPESRLPLMKALLIQTEAEINAVAEKIRPTHQSFMGFGFETTKALLPAQLTEKTPQRRSRSILWG